MAVFSQLNLAVSRSCKPRLLRHLGYETQLPMQGEAAGEKDASGVGFVLAVSIGFYTMAGAQKRSWPAFSRQTPATRVSRYTVGSGSFDAQLRGPGSEDLSDAVPAVEDDERTGIDDGLSSGHPPRCAALDPCDVPRQTEHPMRGMAWANRVYWCPVFVIRGRRWCVRCGRGRGRRRGRLRGGR